jgi:hypothetical protein
MEGATRDGQTMPVELVYVPRPLVGCYSPGSDAEAEDFDPNVKEEQIGDNTPRLSSSVATLRIVGDAPISESPEPVGSDPSFFSTVTPPSPTALVESLLQPLQERQVQKNSVAVVGNEVALCSPSDGQNFEDNLSRHPSNPEDRYMTKSLWLKGDQLMIHKYNMPFQVNCISRFIALTMKHVTSWYLALRHENLLVCLSKETIQLCQGYNKWYQQSPRPRIML